MIMQTGSNALVLNLWGLQASAIGLPAIGALCLIVLALILRKRTSWWRL